MIQPRLGALAADAVHDVVVEPETGLRSGGVRVSVEPAAGSRQQVTMLFNAVPGGNGQSFVFEDERRDRRGAPDESTDPDLPLPACHPQATCCGSRSTAPRRR